MSAYRSKIAMSSKYGYIYVNAWFWWHLSESVGNPPDVVGNWWKNADILCFEDVHASWSWPYVVQNRDKSWRIIFLPLKIMTFVENTVTKRDEPWCLPGLTPHLISAPVTFRSCSPHFTVKLWFPQMLPNFDYGRQIMHTDVKKRFTANVSK